MTPRFAHKLPFGAELVAPDRTRFRLWAPDCRQVSLVIEDEAPLPMEREPDGHFHCEVRCGAGTAYLYQLDDGLRVPDPASRRQRDDVHGPSLVCDPDAYPWQQTDWRGRPWHEMVIYELHVGSCGGFDGVRRLLPRLASLDIGAVELMPVADFSGERNWGYDGVLPFAPARCYGSPDELKGLIDEAHRLGLCVYLDVVYNHFGPDGNHLGAYASPFFHEDSHSPWGAAIDFSQPWVRQFFTHNALYWLREFRFDGLRFDAVHQIGEPAWLDECAAAIRAAVCDRHIHLVLENEHNRASHLAGAFDAQWNDDGHNVLHHLLTGERDSYYRNYADRPTAKLARCLSEGFVYQGEISPTHGAPRGSPSADLSPLNFVLFLQNHDQIGNRAFGERLTTLTDGDSLRAASALQLLCPQIPLLFMGEEWGASEPFQFFTDFHAELADAVREGRRKEFAALPAFRDPETRQRIPDPNAIATFEASRPDFDAAQRSPHQQILDSYRELLALRRRALIPRLPGCQALGAEPLGDAAVVARWRLGDGALLVIAINLGEQPVPFDQREAGLLLYSSAATAEGAELPPRCCWAFCPPLPAENPL
jgi:maltooligosyltrehalose trehalohydrolase